jgi:predicted ester cyclase
MSEDNKRVARRFIMDAFVKNDPAAWEDTLAENVVDHNPMPDQKSGRAGVRQAADMYREAFPDMATSIDLQVAEGDLLTNRGTATGTNTGDLMGMPATGKPAEVTWMDTYRIQDGKIVEYWHNEDVAGMLIQLGFLPEPGSA